jgi:hypothetical protein
MSEEWYRKYHANTGGCGEITSFEKWWLDVYGPPEGFDFQDLEDENDYWIRKGFARIGWAASRNIKFSESIKAKDFLKDVT